MAALKTSIKLLIISCKMEFICIYLYIFLKHSSNISVAKDTVDNDPAEIIERYSSSLSKFQ